MLKNRNKKIQRDERDQIQKKGEAEQIHSVHQEISSTEKQKKQPQHQNLKLRSTGVQQKTQGFILKNHFQIHWYNSSPPFYLFYFIFFTSIIHFRKFRFIIEWKIAYFENHGLPKLEV